MKRKFEINMPRSELEHRISEWVFSERDRKILYRRWYDGISLEPLAEEFDLSVRQINRIIEKYEAKILL